MCHGSSGPCNVESGTARYKHTLSHSPRVQCLDLVACHETNNAMRLGVLPVTSLSASHMRTYIRTLLPAYPSRR
ncbi:hypothetical protein XA68_14277 [Ophiocordyceps unilateralis]|uniref:Uncharacterized protein n=1 Tax=Ophiocordyceps unilateralis TaxID=268505 RepID=A0A2A9PN33_OPHUN|nr:hypothetical protein XA68_14277 [Ophiocordyceps unilateralis]